MTTDKDLKFFFSLALGRHKLFRDYVRIHFEPSRSLGELRDDDGSAFPAGDRDHQLHHHLPQLQRERREGPGSRELPRAADNARLPAHTGALLQVPDGDDVPDLLLHRRHLRKLLAARAAVLLGQAAHRAERLLSELHSGEAQSRTGRLSGLDIPIQIQNLRSIPIPGQL